MNLRQTGAAATVAAVAAACASCGAHAAPPPTPFTLPPVTWVSSPVQSGETLLVQSSPLPWDTCFAFNAVSNDRAADVDISKEVVVTPLFVTDAGAAVVVPSSIPRDSVFSITAVTGTAAASVGWEGGSAAVTVVHIMLRATTTRTRNTTHQAPPQAHCQRRRFLLRRHRHHQLEASRLSSMRPSSSGCSATKETAHSPADG
jgi:hypothetical protein